MVSRQSELAFFGTATSVAVLFDYRRKILSKEGETKMKEYKILTQKDKFLGGKFDPVKLEEALNSYAQQGWRVVATATADIPGWGANRQEMITILERDK